MPTSPETKTIHTVGKVEIAALAAQAASSAVRIYQERQWGWSGGVPSETDLVAGISRLLFEIQRDKKRELAGDRFTVRRTVLVDGKEVLEVSLALGTMTATGRPHDV
jgi:hypothetical protein